MIALAGAIVSPPAKAQVFELQNSTDDISFTERGWLQIVNGGSTITQVSNTYLQLTTTDLADQAGLFTRNPVTGASSGLDYPALDRTSGYSLSFDLRLDAETHVSDNRAGLSVIVISSDLQGIELGFWEDAIFAYDTDGSTGFTRGETVNRQVVTPFPGSTESTLYDLVVAGSAYSLFANDELVLEGSLRDYSGFPGTGPLNLVNPYDKPDLIFIGDDTSQAGSAFLLGDVVLTIPEPSGLMALGVLALGVMTSRRTRETRVM
ncbi:MAG: hypothetical protein AAGH99_09025 [Planctomycetota bacterium]